MTYAKRKPTRLPSWNYSLPGCYFVTFCSHEKECLFGTVELLGNGSDRTARMNLSSWGAICSQAVESAADAYEAVQVDAFVVMPNHLHLLLTIGEEGNETAARSLLSRFVGFVKGSATRGIRKNAPGAAIWQRGYHDHIVRNEADYLRIWEYIENNPARWAQDRYYCDQGGRR